MNQIQSIDRLIHEPMRLAIINELAANKTLAFNDLKNSLPTTDGNLSVHARKLEAQSYIKSFKTFENRISKTNYKLTAKGARALKSYLDQMETLIWSNRLRSYRLQSV